MDDKEFEKELERDNLNMKQEIMLEALAGLVADFEKYFENNKIDQDNNKLVIVKNYKQIRKIYYNLLTPQFSTIKAMDEVIGYYKYTKKWFEELKNGK